MVVVRSGATGTRGRGRARQEPRHDGGRGSQRGRSYGGSVAGLPVTGNKVQERRVPRGRPLAGAATAMDEGGELLAGDGRMQRHVEEGGEAGVVLLVVGVASQAGMAEPRGG